MTTWSLLLAAALLFMIGIIHSWLGEKRLIGPLLAPQTRSGPLARSEFSRKVLRFAWHVTTIAWWGAGCMLAGIALASTERALQLVLAVTAATFVITGLVVLFAGRGRHLGWPVFIAVGVLCLLPLI